METCNSIDEYIQSFPEPIRKRLELIRQTIRESAPEASEKISYAMPTFFQITNLIHFAGFTNHIGLYPTPSGIAAFTEELSSYKSGKGSIQIPHDQPIPVELIRKIVAFRVEENRQQDANKTLVLNKKSGHKLE